MKRINVGCGRKIKDGWVNLDRLDHGQEIVADVFEHFKNVPENTFDEILAEHFIEHFDPDQVIELLNLFYKALKKGGLLHIVVPHKDKDGAWQLSHKTYFTEYTFEAFDKNYFKKDYGVPDYNIDKIITNERKDIHIWMTK